MKVRICTPLVYPDGYKHKKKEGFWTQDGKAKHYATILRFDASF